MTELDKYVLRKAVDAAVNQTGMHLLNGKNSMTPTEAAEAVIGAYHAAVKALDAGGDQSSVRGDLQPPQEQKPVDQLRTQAASPLEFGPNWQQPEHSESNLQKKNVPSVNLQGVGATEHIATHKGEVERVTAGETA